MTVFPIPSLRLSPEHNTPVDKSLFTSILKKVHLHSANLARRGPAPRHFATASGTRDQLFPAMQCRNCTMEKHLLDDLRVVPFRLAGDKTHGQLWGQAKSVSQEITWLTHLLSSTTRSYNGCVGRALLRYSPENFLISSAETVAGCSSTNHLMFSLHGGVVSDPEKV